MPPFFNSLREANYKREYYKGKKKDEILERSERMSAVFDKSNKK